MGTEAPALLAERLIALAPPGMSKVFFGCTGSDANDTQVKIVWYYNNVLGRPEKKKIISRHRGYHGVTVMSGGLTGLPGVHANFDLPLPMIRHTTAPHRLWEAEPGMSDADFAQKLADDLEAADPRRRPGHGRGVHRRADSGRGRRARAAGRLLREGPAGPAPLRRPADRRRGDHRLRTARNLVRERGVRDRARPDHRREGHDLRLRAALGLHRLGEGVACPRRRGLGEPVSSATATRTAPTRSPPRWP